MEGAVALVLAYSRFRLSCRSCGTSWRADFRGASTISKPVSSEQNDPMGGRTIQFNKLKQEGVVPAPPAATSAAAEAPMPSVKISDQSRHRS